MSTFSKMFAGSLVVAALGASSTASADPPLVLQFDNREMEAVLDVVDSCTFTEIIVSGFDDVSHQDGGSQQSLEEVSVNLSTFNSCDGTFSGGSGFVEAPGASVQIAPNGSQGSLSASFMMNIFHSSDGTTSTVPVSVTLTMTANGSPTVTKTHQRQPGIQSHGTTYQVSAIPTGSVTIDSQSFSLATANAFFFLNKGEVVFKP